MSKNKKSSMLLTPSAHKVANKKEQEEQMDARALNGSVRVGGVWEDYLTQKGLLQGLYSCPNSGGGLGMKAFYLQAFTTSFKSKMAVNKLSREKQRQQKNPS